MAKIGEAILEVRAGTATLRQDLAKAERAVDTSARRMRASATNGGRGFDSATSRVVHFRERVDKLERPLSSMRGLMDELGVSANNSTGKIAVFAQELGSTFADGGPLFLGIAAVGVGIAHIVGRMQEAAQAAAKIEFLHLDEEMIDRLAREFDDLGHSSVVALAAVGKEAGLTEEEIIRLGVTAQREAQMSGKSFDESLNAALQRVGKTASQVRRELNAFLSAEFARQAGDTVPFDDEEFNRLLQQQADLEAELAENRRRREEIIAEVPLAERFRFREEERALEAEAERLRAEIAQITAVTDAMLEAREEAQRVLREELGDSGSATQIDRSAQRLEDFARREAEALEAAGERLEEQADRLAKGARQRLARMLAEGNPIETLNVQLQEELDRIAESMAEARAILENPRATEEARRRAQEAIEALQQQDQAARDAYLLELARQETERTRRFMRESGRALAEQMRSAAPRAFRESGIEDHAAEAGAMAGLRFGDAFVTAVQTVMRGAGGPTDWLASLLQIGGDIVSLIPGGQIAGEGMRLVGRLIGSFAEGGEIRGPGGPRSDNLLAWVSPGEFVVNAQAARIFRPLLEAINSGRVAGVQAFATGGVVGATGAAAAGMIVYNDNRQIAAFDPRSMYEAAGITLAPALYRRAANRSDPKLTSIQRRQLAAPRPGRIAR